MEPAFELRSGLAIVMALGWFSGVETKLENASFLDSLVGRVVIFDVVVKFV